MQVCSDWRKVYSVEVMEADLIGFKFHGPGLYLTKTDTILILPMPPNEPPTANNIWHVNQPEGTLYEVYVYNCLFTETIFSAIGVAPVRVDTR